jgi:hypothetical protein
MVSGGAGQQPLKNKVFFDTKPEDVGYDPEASRGSPVPLCRIAEPTPRKAIVISRQAAPVLS